jgi:tRNA pseudouridine55 synthase
MDGLLIVDKPEGITSAEVVRRVKARLRCKTGHLGTLDPFASGVLPLCLGEGTKIAQFLNTADKEYTGRIRLGVATETGDPTGSVASEALVPPLSATTLAEVQARFLGEQLQTPPMYSALKRDGSPLYKLARQGIEVDREPRRIIVEALVLGVVDAAHIEFRVVCSKGTYVRVLAEDLAAALGTVGHLASLRRTRFGAFPIDQAAALSALADGDVRVIALRPALAHLREIPLDPAAARRARQGYEPLLATLAPGGSNEAAKLVGADGSLAAVIGMNHEHGWRFLRVFAAKDTAA